MEAIEKRTDVDDYQESSTWEKLTLLLCQGFWNVLNYCITQKQITPFTKVDVTLVGANFSKVFSYNNGIEVNCYNINDDLKTQFIYDPKDELLNERLITTLINKGNKQLGRLINQMFKNWERSTSEEYPRDVLSPTEFLGTYNKYSVFVTLIGYSNNWQSKEMLQILFRSFLRHWKRSTLTDHDAIKKTNSWLDVKKYVDFRTVVQSACDDELRTKLQISESRGSITTNAFDILCGIASLPYEGASNGGSISILNPLSSKSPDLAFNTPIPFLETHNREIRKILEMTNHDQSLLLQNGSFVGIGKKQKIAINFKGNGKWSLEAENEILLSVEANHAYIVPSAKGSDFNQVYARIFRTNPDPFLDEIIAAARKQKHGTSIVISSRASNEAKRLCQMNRGIAIVPKRISAEMILSITSIDGAIILDEKGICHAIGVILDGEAISKGDTARGARYNSLCNYIEYQKKKNRGDCMAVIISEDKTIDIYPCLCRNGCI